MCFFSFLEFKYLAGQLIWILYFLPSSKCSLDSIVRFRQVDGGVESFNTKIKRFRLGQLPLSPFCWIIPQVKVHSTCAISNFRPEMRVRNVVLCCKKKSRLRLRGTQSDVPLFFQFKAWNKQHENCSFNILYFSWDRHNWNSLVVSENDDFFVVSFFRSEI